MLKRIIDRFRGEASTETLVKYGLTVGENFQRQAQCIIDPSHCWLIKIGDNVTLAPRVHILAHDASTKMHLGYTKIGKVIIGNNVFIGAGSVILPNVQVGNNVIIGAGSVISKDIPDNTVVGGNPATIICPTSEYIQKHGSRMSARPTYDENWTFDNITNDMKKQMKQELENGIGYIV
ncbi:acyltransferase [Peribacillus sp. SCS-155]|uniref:acyltransferase n=1 Tax=Peribacillus sedimenti TaxID=3115297 RepID=UPI0039066D86